ncbi:hypothetical protein [Halococcus saccharolyticus]|uniref:Uncharacterized protein n=1 Tax=Halococcus saccharolyticus DSM 5350 TaxID=1227455 RepID=M0ME34_9EURY|nr:hypothetical protein [Halococcus saccharolyticus]EMA42675.1 hypothetical protein C449_16073 [Halococcus saccharolyticus DSM 5350]
MGFEDLGRTLDNIAESMTSTFARFARSLRLTLAPHPTAEGRRLTEDLCREAYDAVERNDVRVERIPSEHHAGDAADVTYYDGVEWSEVTRYDLEEIERCLEAL